MKIVEVANITSTEPQEIPGYGPTFPIPLRGSPHTEKEWLAFKDAEGEPVFRVRVVTEGGES